MTDKLKIKLDGKSLEHGRIPVNLLTKILCSTQTALFALGEYEQFEASSLRQRGPVPKQVKDMYTLELIGTQRGSFIAELDLPQYVTSTDQTKIFNLFYEAIAAVGSGDQQRVTMLIPDSSTRSRFAKSVVDMIPPNNEYTLSFSQGNNEFTPPISSTRKADVRRLLSRPTEAIREVIGKVVELKILGDSYIGVFQNSKIIRCISPDIENEAFQSIGKEVILKGEAVINDDGTIRELVSVHEVFVAEPGKLGIDQFIYNGYAYELYEGFAVELDFIEEYWTIEENELGILISEPTLCEAMDALYAEIEFLYAEYAKAPDEELTKDAIELRDKLKRVIESVVAI